MTPERMKELEKALGDVTSREIERLVKLQQLGGIEAAVVTQRIVDLSEIAACITTTYRVLAGDFFKSTPR
jgi:hypothetical protein